MWPWDFIHFVAPVISIARFPIESMKCDLSIVVRQRRSQFLAVEVGSVHQGRECLTRGGGIGRNGFFRGLAVVCTEICAVCHDSTVLALDVFSRNG